MCGGAEGRGKGRPSARQRPLLLRFYQRFIENTIGGDIANETWSTSSSAWMVWPTRSETVNKLPSPGRRKPIIAKCQFHKRTERGGRGGGEEPTIAREDIKFERGRERLEWISTFPLRKDGDVSF